MWWKRYEPILEAKPKPGEEVVLDLMAQELCDICEAFPPKASDIHWEDSRRQQRFGPKLPDMPAIDLPLVRLIARLLRFDLGHEPEAIDHLFRNELHRAACPTPLHEEAVFFLWPGLVEVLLAHKEELSGRIKTKDLLSVIDRFEKRFEKRRVAVQ
jgi:hypothetical protein